MNIRVISMQASVHRRETFGRLNRHIRFDFFDAVDGSMLTGAQIENTHLFEENLPYTAGAFGCALSHLALWEEAIISKQAITVAEDDAIFRLDFEQVHAEKLSRLPPDWDIVLWGWNFDSILSLNVMPGISSAVVAFDEDQLRNSIGRFQTFDDEVFLFPLDKCFGLPAYSISPSGAAKFKALCFPLTNFHLHFPLLNKGMPNVGIDIAMNRIYRSTHSHVCFPPLVVTENDPLISTIQNYRYIDS